MQATHSREPLAPMQSGAPALQPESTPLPSSTQTSHRAEPRPSHTPVLHVVPSVVGGLVQAPAPHTSSVHSLASAHAAHAPPAVPQASTVLPVRHVDPSQQPVQQDSVPLPWQVPGDAPLVHASPAVAPAQPPTENDPVADTMTPSTVPVTLTS